MKFTSWQPVLTDHQSYTLEALAQTGPCELNVFVLNTFNTERQSQGWVNQHVDRLSPHALPQKGSLWFAFNRLKETPNNVHIFGSPFERAKLIAVLLLAAAMGRRIYLISEPYSPISAGYQNDQRGFLARLKARLRPMAYFLYGRLLSSRVEGVFAISSLSVLQYRKMGFPKARVFPFGYFIPRQTNLPLVRKSGYENGKTLRVIFVGNLIERKGLDILIRAVLNLKHEVGKGGDELPILLDVYGPGDPNHFNFDRTTIRYAGKIPFGEAQATISTYDLLILPSRFDGWGVVVNEALLAGVPVICSDKVGAADLIGKWSCGATFKSENSDDLSAVLKSLVDSPDLLSDWKNGVGLAAEAIQPQVAGRFMFETINRNQSSGYKPENPWYDCP